MVKFIAISVIILVVCLFVFFATIMVMHHLKQLKPTYRINYNKISDKYVVQVANGLNNNWETIKTFDSVGPAVEWFHQNCIEKK